MSYELNIQKKARNQLESIDLRNRSKIMDKLYELAEDPFQARGVKKLTGMEGYRLRIGDYRAIFEIKNDVLVVVVFEVLHRKDAYRRK